MKTLTSKNLLLACFLILTFILACNAPLLTGNPQSTGPSEASPATSQPPAATAGGIANPLPTFVPDTPTPVLAHNLIPAKDTKPLKPLKTLYDVDSSATASEKRAPYGDSYNINRFERPFTQDMTYVPDLDIFAYSFSQDANFFYVSFELVGSDPNNPIGIDYGVEIDLDADGFGDYIVWAHPPYSIEWTTDNVQVFQDTNHDTGGLSAEKSDAPFAGNGYDTLIFNGGHGQGDDPDLAWVRVNAGRSATVQIAFKKSLADNRFMYGVIADAGIKDVSQMDYVDRYTESDAGSPQKDKKYYPLKAVYAVDNVCRETYGFEGSGQEPQLCPRDVKPQARPQRECPQPSLCTVWDAQTCTCLQGP